MHFGGVGVEIVDFVKVVSDVAISVFFIVVVIIVIFVSTVVASDETVGAMDGDGISGVVPFVTNVDEIIGSVIVTVVTVNDIVSDISVVISLSVTVECEDISDDDCGVLVMLFCVVDRGDRDVGIIDVGIDDIVECVVDFIVVILFIVVISDDEVDSLDVSTVRFY